MGTKIDFSVEKLRIIHHSSYSRWDGQKDYIALTIYTYDYVNFAEMYTGNNNYNIYNITGNIWFRWDMDMKNKISEQNRYFNQFVKIRFLIDFIKIDRSLC